MSIFKSIQRLFKHSAVYGLGHIFNRMIVFLLLPLHTNLFNEAQMGVVGVLFAYLAVFTIIYTYGLDTAFFRFYILEDTDEGKKRILSTAFLTIFITSVIFTVILYFNAEFFASILFEAETHALSIDLTHLVRLTAGILFFDALSFMPFLALRAEERPFMFIFFKFLNVAINVSFNAIYILGLKSGIEGIFMANFWASLLTVVLQLPIIIRRFRFQLSMPVLKELLAFGLPYLPSTLSVALMDTIDRPLLERLDSIDAAGLYSQGAKLGMFMALFVTAFRFAWHPYFLATSKQENAKAIFTKVFTYVLLACAGVYLVLSLYINDIVRISIGGFTILGQEFWSATSVVPVIFLAYIFYAAYLNFIIGIYLEKKTKYLPFITLAGMTGNIVTNVLLIPVIGIQGAAWARVIAYVIMSFALYKVAMKLYTVHYEWGRVIKVALVTGILYFIGITPVFAGNIWLKAVLCILFPVILYVVRFFQPSEINTIHRLLKVVPIPGGRRHG